MKKIAGLTLDQVQKEYIWVARFDTGYRSVGTYAEVEKAIETFKDDLKDVDIVCINQQPTHLHPFFNEYFALTEKHGWLTFPDAFEKFGKEEVAYNIQKTVDEIQKRMANNKSLELKLKNGVTVSITDNSTPYEAGWFLYIGCDLVMGDTTVNFIAEVICSIAVDTKENLRKQFGSLCC